MKRLTGSMLFTIAVLLYTLPLWASVADDVKAKKPVTEILENGILAGLTWEECLCQAIQAGGDAAEIITTALNMGADPQQVIKGAKCAQVSDRSIRVAFAAARELGDIYSARVSEQPMAPIAPYYFMGSGGGGIPASPFR